MDRSHPLVATKALKYGGRSLNVGDRFTASRRDANALKALKRAADAPVHEAHASQTYQTRAEMAEPDTAQTADPVPSKRRYRRRDLTPEP